jgi:hypothetical protein
MELTDEMRELLTRAVRSAAWRYRWDADCLAEALQEAAAAVLAHDGADVRDTGRWMAYQGRAAVWRQGRRRQRDSQRSQPSPYVPDQSAEGPDPTWAEVAASETAAAARQALSALLGREPTASEYDSAVEAVMKRHDAGLSTVLRALGLPELAHMSAEKRRVVRQRLAEVHDVWGYPGRT